MCANEMSVDEMFFRENDMMLYWYTTETVICMKIFILEWLLKTVIIGTIFQATSDDEI
jgi:hypothetical protein